MHSFTRLPLGLSLLIYKVCNHALANGSRLTYCKWLKSLHKLSLIPPHAHRLMLEIKWRYSMHVHIHTDHITSSFQEGCTYFANAL